MSALSLLPTTVDPTQSAQVTSAAELAKRGQVHKTAQNFEASFLTTMFETMFSAVPTDSAFGGGPGEDMWKGFLAEAMAKQTAQHGGIGVARSVEKEMLKLQGLTEPAPASAASPTTSPTASAPPTTPTPSMPVAHVWPYAGKPLSETTK
jgi:Rod binding domain-containing protein